MTPTQRKYPQNISEISETEHYAILTNKSITYDDGYGSPGRPSMSTDNSIQMQVCETQDEVVAWIERNAKQSYPEKFRVVKITPLKVNTSITVDIC